MTSKQREEQAPRLRNIKNNDLIVGMDLDDKADLQQTKQPRRAVVHL